MASSALQALSAQTERLFGDRNSLCPALDWVEEILPLFAAACRCAVQEKDTAALDWWHAWAVGPDMEALQEAGKGAVFFWRRRWIRLLLTVSETLLAASGAGAPPPGDLASELALAHPDLHSCFSPAFWQALIVYLNATEPGMEPARASASIPAQTGVMFPLLLPEPIVLQRQETTILLANFALEAWPGNTGQVFLHPAQAPLFCMDAAFGESFTQAQNLMQDYFREAAGPLSDVCVRIQTVQPGQERFLWGQRLCGPSGAGALALGLHNMHRPQTRGSWAAAASFALSAADTGPGKGGCYPVGGMAEKVRGCARHGIRRLIVAASQQRELALYGRWQGIEIVGAETFAEAVSAVQSQPVAPVIAGFSIGQAPAEDEESGAVPLASRHYIEREEDRRFHLALVQRPMVILVKGARQMGKSSLLIRGVEQSRSQGARVVWTDLQKLNAQDLQTAQGFYLALANTFTRQLSLPVSLSECWNPADSPNMNFEYFLLDHVLSQTTAPVCWFLDAADRLFATSFYSEVFGLMRSWHNDRSVVPLWSRLTLLLSYARESHLFIKEPYQSPFNVGTRLELADFTRAEVADLNVRYGHPLPNPAALNRFVHLVGGHPYLGRRGLSWMVQEQAGIDVFEANADKDSGPLGDHLRRLLPTLQSPTHAAALREALRGRPCTSATAFYDLRSGGLLAGDTAQEAHPRCQVYARYLERYLG